MGQFRSRAISIWLVLVGGCFPLLGQFDVSGRPVQIHGFFTQGFLYSSQNNYLTAKTAAGTFAFTDGGLSLSTMVTPRFRVGAQVYSRKVGELGRGRVTTDWAMGEYKFSDRIGVRAGKVKTKFGLYGDTQDVGALHTWALLPQSVYSLDLRGSFIAHLGGDVFGSLPTSRWGTFSYTAYAGRMPRDWTGGFVYQIENPDKVAKISGRMEGMDFRWNSNSSGVTVGTSFFDMTQNFDVRVTGQPMLGIIRAKRQSGIVFAQFAPRSLRLETEFNWLPTRISVTNLGFEGSVTTPLNDYAWYTAGAYRVNRYVELGTYHSRFWPDAKQNQVGQNPASPTDGPLGEILRLWQGTTSIRDQAFTARFDVANHWDLKVEGHLMNGAGGIASFRGFYDRSNPDGIRRRTNLLVVRLGFSW